MKITEQIKIAELSAGKMVQADDLFKSLKGKKIYFDFTLNPMKIQIVEVVEREETEKEKKERETLEGLIEQKEFEKYEQLKQKYEKDNK